MTEEFDDFDRRLEMFEERVGFARLRSVTGADGVCAHWEDLRTRLSSHLPLNVRPYHFDVSPLESGLVEADWTWQRGEDSVSVEIVVSGAGPARVHERLFAIATETTMVRIPFGPGPQDLGDLAVRHRVPGADAILWAYRNVCVSVDGQGPDVDVEPVARTIQRFMVAHHVPRVAQCLPRVERVDRSAGQINVGDEWRLSLALAKITPAESVMIDLAEIHERDAGCRLETIRVGSLAATYRAIAPGTARVDVRVVDRKTLLSPPLSASVQILPAR